MSYHLNRHDYHIFHTKIYDLVYVCVHCSVLCKYVHCGGSLASCSSLEQTCLAYYIFPRSTHGHIWEMHKLEMYTWKMLKAKYHMKTSAHH